MSFTATTVNSAAAWRPDLFTFEPADVLSDALVMAHTTVSGRIEGDQPVIRVAVILDDEADFVAEGATIEESAPSLSEALVYTRKFAQLVRISREQYTQDGTSANLSAAVTRAMTAKADSALVAQPAPVGPATAPVAGLLNWPGVVTKSVGADLDSLIDMEAAVRANKANPSAWILSPTAWAELRKLKTGVSYNSNLLGAGTDNAEPRLLSIPVVINPEMPAKTGLLVDRNAIVSAVSPLQIATSADLYFDSDSIAVRATWRTGHTIPRPNRIGAFALTKTFTVTLGSPSAGTFLLTFNGRTTDPIARTATAATVKTTLAALDDGFSAADWDVQGATSGPYQVTTPGGVLTGSGAGLTGGTFSVTAA